jgi:hypothetical protein
VSAALHDLPTDVSNTAIAEITRHTRDAFVLFEPRYLPKGRPWSQFCATVGSFLDESLNFKAYVYEDIDAVLAENGFKVVHSERAWKNIMNIKVYRPLKQQQTAITGSKVTEVHGRRYGR